MLRQQYSEPGYRAYIRPARSGDVRGTADRPPPSEKTRLRLSTRLSRAPVSLRLRMPLTANPHSCLIPRKKECVGQFQIDLLIIWTAAKRTEQTPISGLLLDYAHLVSA